MFVLKIVFVSHPTATKKYFISESTTNARRQEYILETRRDLHEKPHVFITRFFGRVISVISGPTGRVTGRRALCFLVQYETKSSTPKSDK